jgi:branched-chain amino acid transport system substrate-binding protein
MDLRMNGLTAAVIASLALFACAKKEEPKPVAAPQPGPAAAAPAPEITVVIGHSAPLTGPQAHLGKDNENGAQLAIDDANAKALIIGGAKVTFKLMGEDDQADPKQGTLVAQKLVDAKVSGVVGHLNSGTTIPASKLYADAGLPQVSPSATNPKYTQQGFKTAFRVMANDVQQGRIIGEYATKQLAAKKIAIIDDRTAYGQGVADEVEKAVKANGGEIVTREFTNDKATDFAAILTKVKSKKPDLVFYGGMDAQAGPMALQMNRLGLKMPLLMADGGCTTEFHKLAANAADGHYCSLPGVPLERMHGGEDFKNRFKAKFNTDIQLYAPYSYDAVGVIVDAMRRANSVEPAKYLPELAKTDGFQGVTAKIAFDEKGDIKDGAITLYQAKGGKWEAQATLGGSPMDAAAAAGAAALKEAGEAVKAAGEAAKAAGVAAKEVAREGVKEGAEAVKQAADAAQQAVEKK